MSFLNFVLMLIANSTIVASMSKSYKRRLVFTCLAANNVRGLSVKVNIVVYFVLRSRAEPLSDVCVCFRAWISLNSKSHVGRELGANGFSTPLSRSSENLLFIAYFQRPFRVAIPILTVGVDAILLLRIYALYNRSKRSKFHHFGG